MLERFLVPIYAPRWLYRAILKAKRAFISSASTPRTPNINIWGERYVEWTFLSKEMPTGPGEAIEFGCEQGYMSLLAAQKGFNVLANDLQQQTFNWDHPAVKFQCGDFLSLQLPDNHYDLAINCSSVEHVGLVGRYGIVAEQSEGDIEVMRKLATILKPKGLLLMTAPCGRDTVMAPWCRVYGKGRLPRLFEGFQAIKQMYWIKDQQNRWVSCDENAALSFQPRNDPSDGHGCSYALGGFVLRKDPLSEFSTLRR